MTKIRRPDAPGKIDEFHGSLADPAIGGLSFLNEIMARYPSAISFAPGAPNFDLIGDVDLQLCLATYLEHVQARLGIGHDRARRLLYEYGSSAGIINDLVAEALKRDGAGDLSAEDIVVTVGAQEAMFLTLRALFRRREQLLAVSEPCYTGIVAAARLLDIELVAIPEARDGPDLAQLRAEIERAAAAGRELRALYVAPDYANPSGTLMDAAARARLLSLAAQKRFFLIEDTAYAFTAPDQEGVPTLKAADRDGLTVLIGTFSKIGLPGARVGFAAAGQQVEDIDGRMRPLASLLATLKSAITVNTSPICQAIIGGLLLLRGTSLTALARPQAALYRRNLTHLLQCLDRQVSPLVEAGLPVSWNRPRGGFYVRVRLPVPADQRLLERSAEEFGVIWTPMRQFHVSGGGENELRLSCSYLDAERIEEGTRRLTLLLASL